MIRQPGDLLLPVAIGTLLVDAFAFLYEAIRSVPKAWLFFLFYIGCVIYLLWQRKRDERENSRIPRSRTARLPRHVQPPIRRSRLSEPPR